MGLPGGGIPPGMMPPQAPPGGMAPSLQAPPANLGPHTIPQQNPGNVLQAMQKLQTAGKLVTEAIPEIPMGTPLHTAALKIASELNKHIGDAKQMVQEQLQTLLHAAAAVKNSGQMNLLNRAAPPPPNQPPAMPPPVAAPGMAA